MGASNGLEMAFADIKWIPANKVVNIPLPYEMSNQN
jgi:hypothetical protein